MNFSQANQKNALNDNSENHLNGRRILRSSFGRPNGIKVNGVKSNVNFNKAHIEPEIQSNEVKRTFNKKRQIVRNGIIPKQTTESLLSIEQSLLLSVAPNELAKKEHEEVKIKQERMSPTQNTNSVLKKRLNRLLNETNSFIHSDSKILGKRRSLDKNLKSEDSHLNSSVESCLDTSVKHEEITSDLASDSFKEKTLDVTSADQDISFDSGINSSNKIDSTITLINGIKIKTENNNNSDICEDVELNEIVEMKKEISQYNLGDLCWGKIGKSAYWPCIITSEPNSSNFQRNIMRKYSIIVNYHVRFFGDNGRRCWIHIHSLMPFLTKNDIQLSPNKPKSDRKSLSNGKTQTVAPKYVPKWKMAVDEAESIKNLPPEERLMEFEVIVANFRANKRALHNRNASVRRAFAESIKKEAEKLEEPIKEIKLEVEETIEESVEENKVPEIDLTISPTIEYLTELYSKNNLFNKISRERVCQVCAKRGRIIKCSGKCRWSYHKECAKMQTIKVKEEIFDENETSNNRTLPLNEQIDLKMREIMKDSLNTSCYPDSDDCMEVLPKVEKKIKKQKKHVCADSTINYYSYEGESFIKSEPEEEDFKCDMCMYNLERNCFICRKQSAFNDPFEKMICSMHSCIRYFHLKCLKFWPQTQWNYNDRRSILENSSSFICPSHVCHTCVSEIPDQAASRRSDRMVRCLLCPAAYHSTDYCIPAGTQILSTTQILCPRHYGENTLQKCKKVQYTINTTWCFLCSRGGNLVCCETCPTSVHSSCLPINLTEDDKFICEDCESGRFPLYGEIVWAKLGAYRWWPAVILFPHQVPLNVMQLFHNDGEFVVKFFGTYNHYWVSKRRTFLFQEGDKGVATARKKVDTIFLKAVQEATAAYQIKHEFKANKTREFHEKLKPPPYTRIKINRPVGKVKYCETNLSNVTACECDPNVEEPCGAGSNCLNRLLMTECNPEVCPAREKCKNQRFEKKDYPNVVPFKTLGRGWGLKTLVPIQRGQFVIEYVGEVINEAEYRRRVNIMHNNKVENYYFLIIDKNRMLDAGSKGNVARFMNHSCEPNCETQKWTVNGETRVGLFAVEDILADTELTFNYNLECIGKEKKVCKCGAVNCSGYIGEKLKGKKRNKSEKSKKRKFNVQPEIGVVVEEAACFVCGGRTNCVVCTTKQCKKYYHLECINKESVQVNKFICPWHNCNICMKRTVRSCGQCLNSYCPQHSNGNIRYDLKLGYICREHDTVPM